MDLLYAALAVGVLLMLIRLIFRPSKNDDTYSEQLQKISEDSLDPDEGEILDDDAHGEYPNDNIVQTQLDAEENDEEDPPVVLPAEKKDEPSESCMTEKENESTAENIDTAVVEDSKNSSEQLNKNAVIINALRESLKTLRKEITAAEREKAQEELEIEETESKILGENAEIEKALSNLVDARRKKIASIEKAIAEKQASVAVLENEIAALTENGINV